jgi:hypothetical protein
MSKFKKEGTMKKAFLGVMIGAVVLAGFAATSFAWEKGTHAYIADLLRKKVGAQNIEEVYGAMAPDVFNYLFTAPGVLYRDWLYEQTHFFAEKVEDAAKTGTDKSAAAGFLSHNNVWGADRTAHTKSLTLRHGEGYVITKAKALHRILMGDPGYAAMFGADDPMVQAAALEICHNFVEAAGDIILKQSAPDLGRIMMDIVDRPKPTMQALMIRAYAADLAEYSKTTAYAITKKEAAGLIAQAETDFRQGCIGYGYLLLGDDATLLANVVDQFRALATVFLALYGLPTPPDEMLTELINGGINMAMQICASDYMTEVNATVDYVAVQLKTHKIK